MTIIVLVLVECEGGMVHSSSQVDTVNNAQHFLFESHFHLLCWGLTRQSLRCITFFTSYSSFSEARSIRDTSISDHHHHHHHCSQLSAILPYHRNQHCVVSLTVPKDIKMKISTASLAFQLLCWNTDAFSVGRTGFAKIPTKLRMSEEDDVAPAPKKIPKRSAVKPVVTTSPNQATSAVEDTKEETVIPAAIAPPSEPEIEYETKEEVVIVEDKVPVAAPVVEESKEIERVVEEPTTSTDSKESEASLVKLPALQRLRGIKVTSVKRNDDIELTTFLKSGGDKSMLVLGTYAADFNAIEYVQRLRYYLPQLQERGITKIGLVLNCEADAAKTIVNMLDLKTDATSDDTTVELFVDPKGEAGRAFGVGTGWRPDDEEMSPYVKLFGMLFGLGAWATLPAVIGGYIGNPFFGQPWIEDAIAVGQRKDRWPNTALDLDASGEIKVNKFKELPYVGSWERRPLELATLRLQNMVDISIKNWKELAPTEDALKAGVLTQLGGLLVIDSNTEEELFRWRDPGICAVANFEDVLKNIDFIENSK